MIPFSRINKISAHDCVVMLPAPPRPAIRPENMHGRIFMRVTGTPGCSATGSAGCEPVHTPVPARRFRHLAARANWN